MGTESTNLQIDNGMEGIYHAIQQHSNPISTGSMEIHRGVVGFYIATDSNKRVSKPELIDLFYQLYRVLVDHAANPTEIQCALLQNAWGVVKAVIRLTFPGINQRTACKRFHVNGGRIRKPICQD